MDRYPDEASSADAKTAPEGGPLPGLLRPPVVFLAAILLGVALNEIWSLPYMPARLRMLGPVVVVVAVLLFSLSIREFNAAGTSVRGSVRSTTIVRTGPYRFSRNPIYLAFILLVLGLSVGLNNLWLLVAAVPAVGVIATVAIPREERFLERNFPEQYASYKSAVRRWL